ncbi:Hypothetical predicted protein [Olea europaea subsp. europaea]|uniref:Uncharacterized protein n=1 Tax=Olea europaea subsp. europaea TaxID=158383 RepID=A0A8S0RRT5_OLEEU|nr:Hypothetical predicted protein [Olea europaea subsp. europaea]
MSVQRRERSQPWRDWASDCGVRGTGSDRMRGASGERSEGRDRKKKLLQRREGNRGPSVFDVSPAKGAIATAEGPSQRFGVRGVGGDRKRGASGERSEGRDRERSQPRRDRASDCGVRGAVGDRKRGASGERSEGRDREKKLLQRGERERSQPRRERASDCGVRGAGGDRKRGPSGERLEGRDRGKNQLQR